MEPETLASSPHREAFAIVLDRNANVLGITVEGDQNVLRAGMFHGVGDGFLRNPVQMQRNGIVRDANAAGGLEMTFYGAALAGLGRQILERAFQPRSR